MNMLRASLILLTSLLLSFAVAGNLLAAEPLTELRDIEVKIVFLDVDEVNNVAQTFTANLATAIRWQDHSLAHQGPGSISKPLDEIWYPSIQMLNQQRIVATFPRMAEIFPDGTVIYRQRYWGNYSQPLELKSFPFDAQKLTLTLANVGFGMRTASNDTTRDLFTLSQRQRPPGSRSLRWS